MFRSKLFTAAATQLCIRSDLPQKFCHYTPNKGKTGSFSRDEDLVLIMVSKIKSMDTPPPHTKRWDFCIEEFKLQFQMCFLSADRAATSRSSVSQVGKLLLWRETHMTSILHNRHDCLLYLFAMQENIKGLVWFCHSVIFSFLFGNFQVQSAALKNIFLVAQDKNVSGEVLNRYHSKHLV